jgi:hypothetical protein
MEKASFCKMKEDACQERIPLLFAFHLLANSDQGLDDDDGQSNEPPSENTELEQAIMQEFPVEQPVPKVRDEGQLKTLPADLQDSCSYASNLQMLSKRELNRGRTPGLVTISLMNTQTSKRER